MIKFDTLQNINLELFDLFDVCINDLHVVPTVPPTVVNASVIHAEPNLEQVHSCCITDRCVPVLYWGLVSQLLTPPIYSADDQDS